MVQKESKQRQVGGKRDGKMKWKPVCGPGKLQNKILPFMAVDFL
jgi:hypothetical protein